MPDFDHESFDSELEKLEGADPHQVKEELERMFLEGPLAELELDAKQHLLDLGWRVDYERWGSIRGEDFYPLDRLKLMADCVRDEPEPDRPRDPGELYLDDLEAAIACLEGRMGGR
jgi:hypothetical protein